MAGKKGMKWYSAEVRAEVVSKFHGGASQRALSREYGISRRAIQDWLKEPAIPKQRGRKPAKTLQEYKYEPFFICLGRPVFDKLEGIAFFTYVKWTLTLTLRCLGCMMV